MYQLLLLLDDSYRETVFSSSDVRVTASCLLCSALLATGRGSGRACHGGEFLPARNTGWLLSPGRPLSPDQALAREAIRTDGAELVQACRA